MPGTAYVVLAHRSPRQLAALVRALAPAPVHLHIDARVPVHRARELAAAAGPRARHLRRRPIRWGSWQVVRAALDGVEAAVADRADAVAILSGQDLPLVTQAELEECLRRDGGGSFVHAHPVPASFMGPKGGADRFRGRHWSIRGRDVRLPLPNPRPSGITPHVASFWSVLDRRGAETVLTAARDPEIERFFSRTWIPDESFFPSVLASRAPDNLVPENPWFIDWGGEDSRHPRTFGSADVDRLAAAAGRPGDVSGFARAKLFARKFDADSTGTDLLETLQVRIGVDYGC